MNVLVAGVTAERQYTPSFDMFRNIKIREGDKRAWQHGTRGDVARTIVCNEFLKEKHYDALLMCDLDQKFPADTLEKLRAFDKDMISAHYMKRTTRGLTSIWQASMLKCDWPYIPLIDHPEGTLRIATTGMGCVLIKRKVIEAVAEILPFGASPFEIGRLPDAAIPQMNFGSDYRFFYLAQKLGFELWGTTDVDTPHASTLWITRNTIYLLQRQRKEAIDFLTESVFRTSIRAKGMISANAVIARIQQLEEAKKDVKTQRDEDLIQAVINELLGWLDEIRAHAPPETITSAWRKMYDPMYSDNIRKIGNLNDGIKLPVFDNRAVQEEINNRDKAISGEDEVTATRMRQAARQEQAVAAASNMHGKNEDGRLLQAFITSTETGELEYME